MSRFSLGDEVVIVRYDAAPQWAGQKGVVVGFVNGYANVRLNGTLSKSIGSALFSDSEIDYVKPDPVVNLLGDAGDLLVEVLNEGMASESLRLKIAMFILESARGLRD